MGGGGSGTWTQWLSHTHSASRSASPHLLHPCSIAFIFIISSPPLFEALHGITPPLIFQTPSLPESVSLPLSSYCAEEQREKEQMSRNGLKKPEAVLSSCFFFIAAERKSIICKHESDTLTQSHAPRDSTHSIPSFPPFWGFL